MRASFTLVLLFASLARAQPTDAAAAAEALFDDGKRLMQAGNYADACAKFEQSQRLDAGVGTLIYLADCYEKSSRAASAWVTFREAAAAARVAGQADREKLARSRAAALEPKLAKLVIDVPKANDVAGLIIHRGSTAVERPLWGAALPVDAGSIVVRAEAPGRRPWTTSVELADGSAPVHVEVPLLEVVSTRSSLKTPSGGAQLEPLRRDEPAPNRTQRTAGFIVSGIGVVAAGTGAYFWLHARSQHDDALSHCNPRCDDPARSLQTDARHSVTIGNIAVIGGAALLAGGVALVVTAPDRRDTAKIRFLPRGPGIGVAGSFR